MAHSPAPRAVSGDTAEDSLRAADNVDGPSRLESILRAYSRRVGDGDVEALALMLGLAEEIDAAVAEAVTGLYAYGYSRAEIGSRLGIHPAGRPAALGSR